MDVYSHQRMEFVFSSYMAMYTLFYMIAGKKNNKYQHFIVSSVHTYPA